MIRFQTRSANLIFTTLTSQMFPTFSLISSSMFAANRLFE